MPTCSERAGARGSSGGRRRTSQRDVCMYVCMPTFTRACLYRIYRSYAYQYTCTHTCIQTCMDTCIHSTYMHVYMHAYIHMFIQERGPRHGQTRYRNGQTHNGLTSDHRPTHCLIHVWEFLHPFTSTQRDWQERDRAGSSRFEQANCLHSCCRACVRTEASMTCPARQGTLGTHPLLPQNLPQARRRSLLVYPCSVKPTSVGQQEMSVVECGAWGRTAAPSPRAARPGRPRRRQPASADATVSFSGCD